MKRLKELEHLPAQGIEGIRPGTERHRILAQFFYFMDHAFFRNSSLLV